MLIFIYAFLSEELANWSSLPCGGELCKSSVRMDSIKDTGLLSSLFQSHQV